MKSTVILTLVFFMVIGLVFVIIPLAYADCPDKVVCIKPELDGVGGITKKTIGTIDNIPTCYKFLMGCRPWYCDGEYKTTSQEYWNDECNKRSPGCRKGGPSCHADFPL